MMKKLNNVLLVSGSGRNCGKTTLACHVISQVSKNILVIGLKITPHFHLTGNKQPLLSKGEGYKIYKETEHSSGKDTARMLKAGATEVYFLQCADVDLSKAFEKLQTFIPENTAIVCESGSFANAFIPGLHLLVRGEKVDPFKKSFLLNLEKADEILTQEDFTTDRLKLAISFSNSKWTFNRNKHDQFRRRA